MHAGRAEGTTGRSLRLDLGPSSGRASPTHITSCRTILLGSYFRIILVLDKKKSRPIFPTLEKRIVVLSRKQWQTAGTV
jgi:hypothetical protein